MQIYTATYIDKFGEENIEIRNDGKKLHTKIRGIYFTGLDFDRFEITDEVSQENLSYFTSTESNQLCGYKIFCDIPIKVLINQDDANAKLQIKLELGEVNETGRIETENLQLTLKYQDFEFHSEGKSGWFEDELIDIAKQLPDAHKLKCCFGCNFSDYHVAGHGLFGDMLCFRNTKEEYLKVSDKHEFIDILEDYEELVQETYLCEEFEARKMGTGYRG